MIRSFKDAETAKVFHGERSTKLPNDIQATARRKLDYIAVATSIRQLASPPANRLEKLNGDREGQWSIRINDQWRICFRWDAPHADDVEITDYH